ncbi:NAD(P)/FAD-dependent oxidoreductase [Nonomuraea sp. NPDC050786]|uniref:FAD-dependent oxidoreductase n=1 Tax=Nonomuraea sp. NPDC050786 TaxID=3154840 RepID=UPI0033EBBEBE
MAERRPHVVVIGGGIGGLCLAQGLRRQGVSVAVYERDRHPRDRAQGFRLHIDPSGSRALRACLPAAGWGAFLATAGDPDGGFSFLSERLERLVTVDGATMYGVPPGPDEWHYPVDRLTLRRVLLSGLEDVVHFGREFTRYDVDPAGRVTAHFADGTEAGADVLVGADGAGSRVRRQLLPHARRVPTGALAVGHKLPLTAETEAWLPPALGTGMNLVLAPSPWFLFTAAFRQRPDADAVLPEPSGPRPPYRDYLLGAFVGAADTLPADLLTCEPAALQAAVAERMAGWHPALRDVVLRSDPASVRAFELMAAEPVEPWPSGPVTVLGDAIHSMPPVGGLGGNTALRDAHLLSRLLGTGGSPIAAIAAYEREMRDYAFAAVRSALATQQQGLMSNRLAVAAARTWFRATAHAQPLRRLTFGKTWSAQAGARPWEQRSAGSGSSPVGR